MYVYVSVLQKYNTKEFTFCLSPVKNPKTTFAIPRYMTAEEGHTDFRFSNNSKSRTKNGLAEEETKFEYLTKTLENEGYKFKTNEGNHLNLVFRHFDNE